MKATMNICVSVAITPQRIVMVPPRISAWNVMRQSNGGTNGVDENDPGTQPASLIDDGFDDIWKFDHYGQRYAQKRFRYRPGPEWKLINEQAVSLFRSES